MACDLNSRGQVVGAAQVPGGTEHAFLWDPAGGMVDLGALGGVDSTAYAINDGGQVLGRYTDADGSSRSFLWANGTMHDLAALTDGPATDWTLLGVGMNNIGQIVGTAWADDGPHAFLLTPVTTAEPAPEPATLALLGLGAMAVLRRGRPTTPHR